ncbi:P-loop containing nucleoside triphosphate hydrolase protein [Mycena vitilis]|nr:P-loop containing nucleoside triphosphate hydrolase protein [Mycena vitilis]
MDVFVVCVLGDEGVGRESFACQVRGTVQTYGPTWDSTFPRIMAVDGRECFVRVARSTRTWPTNRVHKLKIAASIDAYILMYSVSSRASFENLKKHKENREILRPDAVVVLVGNQCDVTGERRQVSTEEGERAAHGFEYNFAETSARTGSGVHGVVEGLVRAARERKEGMKKEIAKTGSKGRGKCQIQ